MNKKQLIVAWITTTLICITLIFFPKIHRMDVGKIHDYSLHPSSYRIAMTQWAYVTPICIAIFLEGLFLILILGDKKK
jgi:hypothetical protein